MTLTDLYQQLFGKNHVQDGDVISMAEHGRSGGVSTGQGFKYVAIPGEACQIADNSVDSNVQYVGKASIGASTSDAVWQIKKIDCTTGTVITWADGNDNYDNNWSNREAISYA